MTWPKLIADTVEKIREPMALDRWDIRTAVEKLEEARACCAAQPEYREALISVDTDKLQTGDDPDELLVHEMTHCHTWPLHALAESLANGLADAVPEYLREGLRKLLLEQVRLAAEQVTTDVGHTYLRLLRRSGVLDTPVSK